MHIEHHCHTQVSGCHAHFAATLGSVAKGLPSPPSLKELANLQVSGD
jgi:hypothetical protein